MGIYIQTLSEKHTIISRSTLSSCGKCGLLCSSHELKSFFLFSPCSSWCELAQGSQISVHPVTLPKDRNHSHTGGQEGRGSFSHSFKTESGKEHVSNSQNNSEKFRTLQKKGMKSLSKEDSKSSLRQALMLQQR